MLEIPPEEAHPAVLVVAVREHQGDVDFIFFQRRRGRLLGLLETVNPHTAGDAGIRQMIGADQPLSIAADQSHAWRLANANALTGKGKSQHRRVDSHLREDFRHHSLFGSRIGTGSLASIFPAIQNISPRHW